MAISKWLTRKEVAEVIRISVVKLDRMRLEGNAPPEMKIGRAVRFAESDLELWLQQQSVTRFSKATGGAKSLDRREKKKSRYSFAARKIRSAPTKSPLATAKKPKVRTIRR